MNMEHQATIEHLNAALKGIFTNYVLLQSTASAIQSQPSDVQQSLQLSALIQTPIREELLNHQKRLDLCQAIFNILTLIERITKRIAESEKTLIPLLKRVNKRSAEAPKQPNIHQLITEKLHQLQSDTFGTSVEHFSPQWQLLQIRQAITKILDEREIQDQLCLAKSANDADFPSNIQQLSKNIIHTQVTLKSLIQQQAKLLIESFDRPTGLKNKKAHTFTLNDALIANPQKHPIVVAVALSAESPQPIQTGWLREFAQLRERIKITFKKHEMQLNHLTPDETAHAKLISLLCQTELFRLLLKDSLRKIDRAITEVDALCERLNTLITTHTPSDTQDGFITTYALLCQDCATVYQFVATGLVQMRTLSDLQIPHAFGTASFHDIATEA